MGELGHREAKKRRSVDGIVEAAHDLFTLNGFDGTKVEDIAERADVSPGTVYNYFGTKGAILAAVTGREMEGAMVRAAEALDTTAQDPVDALMPVLEVYVAYTAELGRGLLKEILRAGLEPDASDLLSDLASMDMQAIEQIGEALITMQSAGLIRESADPVGASMLVYSVLAAAEIWYVSDIDMEPDAVVGFVRSQLRIAFDGLLPMDHGGSQ